MNQITTHVLDTSLGKPAAGIAIALQYIGDGGAWEDIVSGVTNEDGRVPDFLPDSNSIAPGTYRMLFQTGEYFKKNNTPAFYPYVSVVFVILDTEHYHIPLLLSPYGYSTYRGS